MSTLYTTNFGHDILSYMTAKLFMADDKLEVLKELGFELHHLVDERHGSKLFMADDKLEVLKELGFELHHLVDERHGSEVFEYTGEAYRWEKKGIIVEALPAIEKLGNKEFTIILELIKGGSEVKLGEIRRSV